MHGPPPPPPAAPPAAAPPKNLCSTAQPHATTLEKRSSWNRWWMSAVSHSSLQHEREGLAGRWQTNVWLPGASTLYWQMWTNSDSSFFLHQALAFLRQSLFLLGCLTGLALEVCSPLAEIRRFLVKQGLHQEKTSALEQLPFAHTTKQNVYITDSLFVPKTARNLSPTAELKRPQPG